MMEKRYELLIIYLMCLCNRFLLEIHYLGKFTGKFILCQKNVAKSKMCGVSVLFCLGGGMIVLQVTVHKSLTLFTRQAQGILLLGSVFSHLRKFLQKEIRTSLRKNLRK